jgi:drug/metabolite transporter (DMT)-like permease
LRKVQWLGLGIGFVGILAIAFPSLGSGEEASSLAGYIYVLVAAFGVAVGNLAIKRVAHRVDVVLGMGAQLLIGSLPLLVLARSLEQTPSTLLAPCFIGILLIISFAGTAVAFILWCLALRHIELSRANTFSFLTPLFAILIGYVSYGERFGWYDALGGVLILLSLWCVSRNRVQADNSPASLQASSMMGDAYSGPG